MDRVRQRAQGCFLRQAVQLHRRQSETQTPRLWQAARRLRHASPDASSRLRQERGDWRVRLRLSPPVHVGQTRRRSPSSLSVGSAGRSRLSGTRRTGKRSELPSRGSRRPSVPSSPERSSSHPTPSPSSTFSDPSTPNPASIGAPSLLGKSCTSKHIPTSPSSLSLLAATSSSSLSKPPSLPTKSSSPNPSSARCSSPVSANPLILSSSASPAPSTKPPTGPTRSSSTPSRRRPTVRVRQSGGRPPSTPPPPVPQVAEEVRRGGVGVGSRGQWKPRRSRRGRRGRRRPLWRKTGRGGRREICGVSFMEPTTPTTPPRAVSLRLGRTKGRSGVTGQRRLPRSFRRHRQPQRQSLSSDP
jgi:hypothetical protein